MQEMVIILVLAALVGYWWDTSWCNERALRVCLQLCQSVNVQLLDSTVNRQRTWLRRSPAGGIQICRLYDFTYSDDSESRQYGYIVLLGHEVVEQSMQTLPVNL